MSVYVVDASVAAKWFTEEEHSEAAVALASGPHELHAPDFFMLEMDNVLCKWIRRGIITEADGAVVRSTLARLPIQTYPFGGVRDDAYALANDTRRSLYDCLYLAVAVHLDAQLVTADRRLYDAVADGPFAGHVVWVEDVP
ncbi:MAG: type II toxin-antitoxin system VapC family toxin [Armatimonadota bacterium]